jgi:hypothetical protein
MLRMKTFSAIEQQKNVGIRMYQSKKELTMATAAGGALSILRFGGRDGIRTHDLLIANSGENKLRQGATIT